MDASVAKEQYKMREKRVNDAICLKTPDRVPIVFADMQYYMTKVMGISNKDAMNDHQKRLDTWITMTQKYNLDLAVPPVVLPAAQPFSILDIKQFKWPGGSLPDDAAFQFVEKEYLKADEYDEFLSDPGDFTIRKLWPRIATTMSPFGILPPLHWFSNGRNMSYMLGPLFGMPPFANMFEKLIDFGKAAQQFTIESDNYMNKLKRLGIPLMAGAAADAPFDYLTDQLRGMKGAMLDMFRQPEKIMAAMDLFTQMAINCAKLTSTFTGNKRVYMPLHRGSADFMGEEQFEKFYWPGLKKVFQALIDAGLTPLPSFEGNYTPRLKYLAELPKGKIMGHFNVVDRKKAKKIIGNTMCFWGNVSAQRLVTGTADQVRDDTKDLIDTFADNGGLIIDSSMVMPDQAKPENVEAMIDTVFTYGVNN